MSQMCCVLEYKKWRRNESKVNCEGEIGMCWEVCKRIPLLPLFFSFYMSKQWLGWNDTNLTMRICWQVVGGNFPISFRILPFLIGKLGLLAFINIGLVGLLHNQSFLGLTLIIGPYQKTPHINSPKIDLIFELYQFLKVVVSLLGPICEQGKCQIGKWPRILVVSLLAQVSPSTLQAFSSWSIYLLIRSELNSKSVKLLRHRASRVLSFWYNMNPTKRAFYSWSTQPLVSFEPNSGSIIDP